MRQVEFSPFHENRVAVATAQYYGIIGNGRQHILEMDGAGQVLEIRHFDTQDGLYDCCWNEANENQLVSASADGSIKMWDLNARDGFPIRNWHEHSQEVSSVDWNLASKDTFISSSWDNTIKVRPSLPLLPPPLAQPCSAHCPACCPPLPGVQVWNPVVDQSICTYAEHQYCVYNAIWNPHSATTFVSCSGDNTIKIFDVGQPSSVATIQAHQNEVLAVDWNKYNEFLVATGSVDQTIKTWVSSATCSAPSVRLARLIAFALHPVWALCVRRTCAI